MKRFKIWLENKSPKIGYHVTPIWNLLKIKKQGLIPQSGRLSNKLGESGDSIFLFSTIDDMENALYNWLGEEYEELEKEMGQEIQLAVLKVKIPEDSTVSSTVDYEFQVFDPIPPENIIVIDTDQ